MSGNSVKLKHACHFVLHLDICKILPPNDLGQAPVEAGPSFLDMVCMHMPWKLQYAVNFSNHCKGCRAMSTGCPSTCSGLHNCCQTFRVHSPMCNSSGKACSWSRNTSSNPLTYCTCQFASIRWPFCCYSLLCRFQGCKSESLAVARAGCSEYSHRRCSWHWICSHGKHQGIYCSHLMHLTACSFSIQMYWLYIVQTPWQGNCHAVSRHWLQSFWITRVTKSLDGPSFLWVLVFCMPFHLTGAQVHIHWINSCREETDGKCGSNCQKGTLFNTMSFFRGQIFPFFWCLDCIRRVVFIELFVRARELFVWMTDMQRRIATFLAAHRCPWNWVDLRLVSYLTTLILMLQWRGR